LAYRVGKGKAITATARKLAILGSFRDSRPRAAANAFVPKTTIDR
jgi:hypothetical protein